MEKIHLKRVKKPKKIEVFTRKKAQKKKNQALTVKSIILILLVGPFFLWGVYMLINTLTTRPAKIKLYYRHANKPIFKSGNVSDINQLLARDVKVQVKVEVIARPDYYKSLDGQYKNSRDRMKVELGNSQGKPALQTTVVLRPDPRNPGLWRGRGFGTLDPRDKEGLQLTEFIRLTRTNSTGTASQLTRRMSLVNPPKIDF